MVGCDATARAGRFSRLCTLGLVMAAMLLGLVGVPKAAAYTGTGTPTDPILMSYDETYSTSHVTIGYVHGSGWTFTPISNLDQGIFILTGTGNPPPCSTTTTPCVVGTTYQSGVLAVAQTVYHVTVTYQAFGPTGPYLASENIYVSLVSILVPNPYSTLVQTQVCGPDNDILTFTAVPPTVTDDSGWNTTTHTRGIHWWVPDGYVMDGSFEVGYFHIFTDFPAGGCTSVASPDFTVTGVCGVGNDTVVVLPNGTYTASAPTWTGSQVSVTYTMSDAYPNLVFPNGLKVITVTKTEVDTSPCITTVAVPGTPSVTDPCGAANATWVVPADSATFAWTSTSGALSVSIVAANTRFPDGTTVHSFGSAPDSGTACVVPTTTPAATATTTATVTALPNTGRETLAETGSPSDEGDLAGSVLAVMLGLGLVAVGRRRGPRGSTTTV